VSHNVPIIACLVEKFEPACVSFVVHWGSRLDERKIRILVVIWVRVIVVWHLLLECTVHTVPPRIPSIEKLVFISIVAKFH
jgi:hypothetical protein